MHEPNFSYFLKAAQGKCRLEEAEEGDKEAEPSWKGRRALNPSFSGRGETFLPCEKGKVRVVVDFVFSIVDQLLTRSLGLE